MDANPLLALVAALGGEALKTWGSLAIVVSLLGWMLYLSDKRSRAKDATIDGLQAEIRDARTENREMLREMIRVARETEQARALRRETDELFLPIHQKILQALASSDARPTIPESR